MTGDTAGRFPPATALADAGSALDRRPESGPIGSPRGRLRYILGTVVSLGIPAYLKNDVVRAVALNRRDRVIAEVGTSTVVERVLGPVTLGLLCLVSLALVLDRSGRLPLEAAWVAGGLGLGLPVIWLPLSAWEQARFARWRPTATGRWLGLVDRVAGAFAAYRRRPRLLWLLGALSFLEQCLVVAFYWMAARALGVPAAGALDRLKAGRT